MNAPCNLLAAASLLFLTSCGAASEGVLKSLLADYYADRFSNSRSWSTFGRELNEDDRTFIGLPEPLMSAPHPVWSHPEGAVGSLAHLKSLGYIQEFSVEKTRRAPDGVLLSLPAENWKQSGFLSKADDGALWLEMCECKYVLAGGVDVQIKDEAADGSTYYVLRHTRGLSCEVTLVNEIYSLLPDEQKELCEGAPEELCDALVRKPVKRNGAIGPEYEIVNISGVK